MLNTCLKHIWAFVFLVFVSSYLSIGQGTVYAIACGNGNCQSGETCLTCPTDCGACPTNTPVPGQPTNTPVPGQPTNTPVPGSTTTTSSTSSVSYYPSVGLAPFSSNPTNKTSLSFSGTASIEQGTISLVEYTITDGASWIQAQPVDGSFNGKDEFFTFTASNLTEGKYTIKVRAKSGANVYTKSESYALDTVTIATTPPQITLDKIKPNPTKNQTPTLTGKATAKLVDIARVDVSIDNGKSWQIAKKLGNTFNITLTKLEDGNYPVIARAFDSAGNIGKSDTQTLIIDTIPPIIGGGMQSLGPQVLIPDKNGTVSIVSGADTTIAMTVKGGPTEVKIKAGSDSFKLSPKTGTNLWAGKIKFEKRGEKPLVISAVDGAGNSTERNFNTLVVENSGMVSDKETKQAIKNAKVSTYFFETVSKRWILWEAQSYGQKNPQKTDSNGFYSFLVPAGKYYLEAKAPVYNSLQSEIITVSQTSILNYALLLAPKPKIEFTLPAFGKVVFAFPSFSLPETFSLPNVPLQKQTAEHNIIFKVGAPAPNFSLPNFENKEVNLAAFKGKRLLVSFISPWSSLSLEQAPFLSEASLDLAEDQALLVVSLQESNATTQTLMKKGNYKFPVVADKDGKTAAQYKITILPQHVFIDANGKIQETFTGVLTKEELLKKLADVP